VVARWEDAFDDDRVKLFGREQEIALVEVGEPVISKERGLLSNTD
jgi:hypothetical protein